MQDGNVKFDYAGGLIRDIRGGNSVEVNTLDYCDHVQIYGIVFGNVWIIIGAGAQKARVD